MSALRFAAFLIFWTVVFWGGFYAWTLLAWGIAG
jgi:hypothetical protein